MSHLDVVWSFGWFLVFRVSVADLHQTAMAVPLPIGARMRARSRSRSDPRSPPQLDPDPDPGAGWATTNCDPLNRILRGHLPSPQVAVRLTQAVANQHYLGALGRCSVVNCQRGLLGLGFIWLGWGGLNLAVPILQVSEVHCGLTMARFLCYGTNTTLKQWLGWEIWGLVRSMLPNAKIKMTIAGKIFELANLNQWSAFCYVVSTKSLWMSLVNNKGFILFRSCFFPLQPHPKYHKHNVVCVDSFLPLHVRLGSEFRSRVSIFLVMYIRHTL